MNKDIKPNYYIGIMSGTSLDGVDAALVEIKHQQLKLKSFLTFPIEERLTQQLLLLNSQANISLSSLSQLEHDMAQNFIRATKALLTKNNLKAKDIQVIGSHGQTIFHDAKIPMSLQIGHPAFIAKQTGIPTVADFRVDDMALGGQGAPLAPAFHAKLFQNNTNRVLVNIGGIANLSFLPKNNSNQVVTGLDTGPGNALMDEWCQTHFNRPYDKDGIIALSAQVNKDLLNLLLKHPYFKQRAPKSTGRGTFNLQWLNQQINLLGKFCTTQSILATLTQLTATTIANDIKQHKIHFEEVLICGGGAKNLSLFTRIQAELSSSKVMVTDTIGINGDAIEAMMCAWLAEQRTLKNPINLQHITGAKKTGILGGIWLP